MSLHFIKALFTVGLWSGSLHPSTAETRACYASDVSVTYEAEAHAGLVCDAARQAATLFAQCNIPPLARPIDIRIVEELGQGCLGLYHCGEDIIEVLSPSRMQKLRGPKSAFKHLPLDMYFRSIIVHELAHAATEGLPCPFDACVVAHEYVAYTAQVLSLGSKALARFEEESRIGGPVSSYELSAVILFLSPNLFARKVWAHFGQRKDSCGYIGDIIGGKVLLDAERF